MLCTLVLDLKKVIDTTKKEKIKTKILVLEIHGVLYNEAPLDGTCPA
jgi:thermostable 8-oxoguanine DNA glycosylase